MVNTKEQKYIFALNYGIDGSFTKSKAFIATDSKHTSLRQLELIKRCIVQIFHFSKFVKRQKNILKDR